MNTSNHCAIAVRYIGKCIRFARLCFVVLVALLAERETPAADYIWQTTGTTNNWSTDAGDTNWHVDSGTVLSSWIDGNAAVFNATTDTTVTLTGIVAPTSITFGGGWANSFTLSGGTLAFGTANGMIHSSAVGTSGSRVMTISGNLTGSAGLTINAHGDLSANGGGNSARLVLSGDNSGLTGGIEITGGLVEATNATSFGANTVTLSNLGGILHTSTSLTLGNNIVVAATGGTIRNYGAATTTLTGAVSGSGTLRHTDSGRLIFGGDLSGFAGIYSNLGGNTVIDTDAGFKGAVEITAGSLAVGNNSTRGSLKDASSITIGTSATLLLRRTDVVSASDLLPSSIVFAAAGSTLEINPTDSAAVVNYDMDLGSSTTVGTFRVSGGTVNLVSGTDVVVNSVSIGLQNATNRGTLTIEDGSSLTTLFFNIGANSNNSGTVNQTGGLVTLQAGGSGFRLGHWTNGSNPESTYNLTGGTLDATALSGNSGSARFISIGWDGASSMTVGGGTGQALLKAYGVNLDVQSSSATVVNTLTVKSNGTVELGAGGTAAGSLSDVIFLTGGTLKATASATWAAAMDAGTATTSTLDVNGNLVTVNKSVTGTGTLRLSDTLGGGQLILNNGSSDLTVAAGLSGNAAISKTGSGALLLSGSGNYAGTITVSAGSLNLTGTLGSATAVMGDGSTLLGEGTLGSLVMGASTGATLQINPLTADTGLNLTGDVTLNGTIQVVFAASPVATGTPLVLFSYGGTLAGLGNLSVTGLANYRTGTIADSGGVVTLDLGNKDLVWNGTSGGQWQVGGVNRWNAGEADAFYWGDNVRFDDTGVAAAVVIAGEVRPASIVVDADTKAYSITGGAGNFISGMASLLKSGSASLTMSGPNTYSGGTTISEGAIYVQTAAALGAGAVTLGDASTGASNVALYLDGGRVSYTNSVVISANGTGTATLGSRSTVTGTGSNNYFGSITLARDVIFDSNASDRTDYRNITGTGNVTVSGSGRSIFTTANTFAGNLTVSTSGSGSLQLGVNSSVFNAIPDASNVTVSSGALLNLSYASGVSESINGLFGAGTVGNNGGFANTLIVGASNGDGDFSGLIRNGGAAAFSFTKSGAGVQKLSGLANTYTGITTVLGGVLEGVSLGNGGVNSSIGASSNAAGNLILNGGVLRYSGSSDASTDRLFTVGTSGGGVESSGAGTLTLAATDAVVLSGTDTARTFSLGGTNTGANTFAGLLADNGTGLTAFVKNGTGSWTLAGLNTYTGITTIAGGTLNVAVLANGGVASGIGQSAKAGSNLVLNGGTLRYTGASVTTDRAFQTGALGGAIEVVAAGAVLQFGSDSTPFTLAGTLTKTGAGTLRLINYTGSTAAASSDLVIDAGVVEFGTSYFNRSPFGKYGLFITVNDGGVLRTTTSHALGGDNIDAGTSLGQIRVLEGGSFQVNGTQYLSGGLVSGEGRLVLQGGVVEGSSDLRAVSAGSTITTLASDAASEIRNLGGISLEYGGLTVDVADGAATVDLLISAAIRHVNNGVVKNGAGLLELTGTNNNYGGGTTVNAGTLLVNNGAPDQSGTGSGLMLVEAGATLGGRGAVLTSNQNITINGRLMVGLEGDTIMSSDMNFHLGAGTGSITLNGMVELDIFGQIDDTFGDEHGTDLLNDSLKVTSAGSVVLGGVLKVNDASEEGDLFNNSASWNEGDSWQLFDWSLLTAGTVTGNFATFELPTLADGLTWYTGDLATTGVISIVAVPEPEMPLLLSLALALFGARRRRKTTGVTTRGV